jgi:CheY-like chemotaxis protein
MAKKILIVEDEELLLNFLERKFSELDYEVVISKDGLEAFKYLQTETPDLILLDIIMPKMGGFELMEKIKEDPSIDKKIPIIIISNSGQPVEIEKAKKLGADDWLIKTEFDPQEVVDKVVRQIGEPSQ